jgi:hypothetical protein
MANFPVARRKNRPPPVAFLVAYRAIEGGIGHFWPAK